MEQLVMKLLKEGHLSLPTTFLRYYKQIGLTDHEMMLIIQIMSFKRKGKDFPTIAEIRERMTADEGEMIGMLQKLVQNGYLSIEDHIEPNTGVRAESFQLDPLYEKIAQQIASESQFTPQKESEQEKSANLFSIFEEEFGRPLSPIECETIAMWQDQDQYKDELIIAALREAVMSNKLFIRYIDRILYEWQRNRIYTAEQAREFSLKFRRKQSSGGAYSSAPGNGKLNPSAEKKEQTEPFPFYNWLEN